jgi:glycerophosphoryl diester phosphodiesterase
MPSFRTAVEAGVDGLETDLRVTSDGFVVLIHDEGVNRTTNGGLRNVRDMTFAEIERLDAGSWFSPSFAGTRVPLFSELLDYVQPIPDVFIVLDIKDYNISHLIAPIVIAHGMQQRVIASCWVDEVLVGMRSRLNVTTMQFLGSYTGTDPGAWIAKKRLTGYTSFSLDYQTVPDAFFSAVRSNLLPLVVWTVDDPAELQRMKSNDVFAIITNRCRSAIAVVGHEGVLPVFVTGLGVAGGFVLGMTVALLACCWHQRSTKRQHRYDLQ